jgi:hypothetical protein
MRSTILLSIAAACAPAMLAAQQASASASANAQADVSIPAGYSASAKAAITNSFQAAREKNLPDQPMRERMAEGQAKGASDAQVAAAVRGVEARLEASQSAMISAGRANPTADETTAGAQAMERGATQAQIEALAKHAPSGRSLAVAFTVLSDLQARGEPTAKAVSAIQSKLDARASDEAIVSLASNATAAVGLDATANARAGSASAVNGASAAGNAAAGVSGVAKGATGAVGGAAGVTGSVTGVVTGVVKKP